VKKVLSKLFVVDVSRGFVVIHRQLLHGMHVSLLGLLGQAAQLHILDHSLSYGCHHFTSHIDNRFPYRKYSRGGEFPKSRGGVFSERAWRGNACAKRLVQRRGFTRAADAR
jgi:hypothetical protein